MNPSKVKRENLNRLTDLPNIGKSIAFKLEFIGIDSPNDLKDKDPFELYKTLCIKSGKKYDPCVLDVFMSITDFINGGEPKVWWEYTKKRKEMIIKDNSE